MKVMVGLTATSVDKGGRGRPLIQNLGPGTVYLDTDQDATVSDGLQLSVGDVYEFPGGGSSETVISLISTIDATDVRIIRMAEG